MTSRILSVGIFDRLDARRVFAELSACAGDRLRHLAEDVQTAFLRLSERDAHDLFGDAGDLDVHLQRRDTLLGACHLEVHVAEVIFITEDVGQNDILVALFDQAHRNAGDG